MNRIIVFLLMGLVLSTFQASAQNDMQTVIELLNQGDFEKAQDHLRQNLQQDAEDIDSRLLLGTVYEYLGDTDTAIKIWAEGLNKSDNDYALYMSIGELRLRQGIRGNSLKYSKGYLQSEPITDSLEESRYTQKQLVLAIQAFKKAVEFYPYESDAWQNLAMAYEHLNQPEEALRCWLHLNDVYPTHDEMKVHLGNIRLRLGHLLEAKKSFEEALKINPRLHSAYSGMSEYYLAVSDVEQAEKNLEKSEFYKWLPSFCKLPYTPDNYSLYEAITQNSLHEEEQREKTMAIVAQLKASATEAAADFLATICWYHEDKNDIEIGILDNLAERGLYGAKLLHELAKNSDQVFIIGESVKRLVRMNAPGTFDLLVTLLPQDRQPFQSMNIAEQMALLQDDRAILYLIKELNPTLVRNPNDKEPDFETLLVGDGIQAARQRAALALSAFNHPVAISALQQGLHNENVNVYCSASLYKLTGETKYLSIVETFLANRKDKLLMQFFSRIETKEAENLLKRWN